MRLIDADVLTLKLRKIARDAKMSSIVERGRIRRYQYKTLWWTLEGVIKRLNNGTVPTIDAVPVVHCQDCKHQRKVWRTDKRYKAGGYWVICGCKRNEDPFVAHTVDGQDGEFCSAGERKE